MPALRRSDMALRIDVAFWWLYLPDLFTFLAERGRQNKRRVVEDAIT